MYCYCEREVRMAAIYQYQGMPLKNSGLPVITSQMQEGLQSIPLAAAERESVSTLYLLSFEDTTQVAMRKADE